VLLDDVAGRDVPGTAAALAAALAGPGVAPVGVTWGLAPHGRSYASVSAALRAADIALRRAEAHGGHGDAP
jgi:hypothetical protein